MKSFKTLVPAILSAAILGAAGCQENAETVPPSQSTKQGSGQMKTPAGMERPTIDSGLAKPAATDLTHVLTKDSTYYTSSPAQAKPADGTLKAGTKLLLIMPSGSYAQVWAENGVKGYVPTANIESLKK